MNIKKFSLYKIILIMAVIMLIFSNFAFSATAYEPDFTVNAKGVLLYSLEADEVVYEKNADQKMHPASITKLMTAILVAENVDDYDEVIVAKRYIIEDINSYSGAMTAGILPGEEIKIKDLMHCLLIQSANDSASILADYVGGGNIDNFIDMMNNRAVELGCTNTNFENPHGLHDEKQVSSARDIMLIMKHVKTLPMLEEIMSTTAYQLPKSNLREPQSLTPTNKMLLKENQNYYPNLDIAKTGYLPESGRCMVAYASKNGYNYICVALNCGDDSDSHFKEISQLLNWGFETFQIKVLLEVEEPITEVPVSLGKDEVDYVLLQPKESYTAIVPKEIDENSVVRKFNLPKSVDAPIEKGDIIGNVDLMLYGDVIATIDLLAYQDVGVDSFEKMVRDIQDFIDDNIVIMTIILVGVIVLIIIILSMVRTNRKKKRRNDRIFNMNQRRRY